MSILLDGKLLAEKIKDNLRARIADLKKKEITPGLAVVLAGDDPSSQIYVKNKKRTCEELGIYSEIHNPDASVSESELVELIRGLNEKETIHGIIVQLPLPEHIDRNVIAESINPVKDVDCLHPYNFGRMALGKGSVYPCTPSGIMEMLRHYSIDIESKEAVVVGRSNIVGKPASLMLLNGNATVTICHLKTRNFKSICRRADILVSAAGHPGLIKKDMVKQGAVIIDVGITRLPDGKISGDVDFENVKDVAGHISPVPGGVGPMTIAMLMKNVVEAGERVNSNQ